MIDDFRQWLKTKHGLEIFDSMTYGWILGVITVIILVKLGFPI